MDLGFARMILLFFFKQMSHHNTNSVFLF
jgi:hypothetical protein